VGSIPIARSMNISETELKARRFVALHATPGIFEIPNPWDAGSARMLEKLGAVALATSSGASAMAQGSSDGRLGRDATLAHARDVAAACSLPVSVDLENGFGDSPDSVAETIRLATQTGVVGASIEDYRPGEGGGIYEFAQAVQRVAAAAQAARAAPFPFTVTARCENHLRGVDDLSDTIRRLQAYADAGADVLFAPALPDLAAVRAVCAAVNKPVSFMVGLPGKSFSRAELAACGIRRLSFGPFFYRRAMAAAEAAATEALRDGTYSRLLGGQ
jgi:2-methylisocitrate lyase-like PEP mutase family enzyme